MFEVDANTHVNTPQTEQIHVDYRTCIQTNHDYFWFKYYQNMALNIVDSLESLNTVKILHFVSFL